MKKIIFSFAVLIFIVFSFYFAQTNNSLKISGVKIAGQEIKVDLAITKMEHNRGLSGRTNLKEDEGMLFVFETPGEYGFWMKDMFFPIDIIWITEVSGNMKVVYIKKDARPESYPEVYNPDQPAKYILEVVSGFSEKNNLKVGDKVEFLY